MKTNNIESSSVFLSNLHYFFAQTDGIYNWPPGAIGDLLKQAKKEIEHYQKMQKFADTVTDAIATSSRNR